MQIQVRGIIAKHGRKHAQSQDNMLPGEEAVFREMAIADNSKPLFPREFGWRAIPVLQGKPVPVPNDPINLRDHVEG